MRFKIETFLFNALMFTLPWIGLGIVKTLTGVDTGAGFQVSYFLAALLLVLNIKKVFKKSYARILVSAIIILGAGLFLQPGIVDYSSALSRYFKQFIQLLIMIGITMIPFFYYRKTGSSCFNWLAYGLLFQFGYSILQTMAFNGWLPWFDYLEMIFTSNPSILSGSEELVIGSTMSGIPRIRGTACEPLLLGNYLVMVVPWLIIQPWRRSIRFTLLAIGVLMLMLTWSRGAWLGAAAAAMTALVLLKHARILPRISFKSFLPVLGIAIPVLVLVSFIAPIETLYARLLQTFDTTDWSNLTRLYSMQAAWRAFLLSPVVGIGWGQFAFHFDILVDPLGLQSQFTWPVVNNFPLKILAETGLFGFGLFVFGLAKVVQKTFLRLTHDSRNSQLQIVVASSSFAGVFVQMLTFSQYNVPHIWVALGLLLVLLYRGEQ